MKEIQDLSDREVDVSWGLAQKLLEEVRKHVTPSKETAKTFIKIDATLEDVGKRMVQNGERITAVEFALKANTESEKKNEVSIAELSKIMKELFKEIRDVQLNLLNELRGDAKEANEERTKLGVKNAWLMGGAVSVGATIGVLSVLGSFL